jgi:serine/threonine protein kinase
VKSNIEKKYLLKNLIGEGGYANVYKASKISKGNEDSKKIYAVKVIRKSIIEKAIQRI